MLDTGTAPSVIDTAVAKKIGIKVGSAGQQGTGGGQEAVRFFETSLPQVGIGGFTFKNVAALAGDLNGCA